MEPVVVHASKVVAKRNRLRKSLVGNSKLVSISNICLYLFLQIALGRKQWEFRGGKGNCGDSSPRSLCEGDFVCFRCAAIDRFVFCKIGKVVASQGVAASDGCESCAQEEKARAGKTVVAELIVADRA